MARCGWEQELGGIKMELVFKMDSRVTRLSPMSNSVCPLCGESMRWTHKPSQYSFPVEWCICSIPMTSHVKNAVNSIVDDETLKLFGLKPSDLLNQKINFN